MEVSGTPRTLLRLEGAAVSILAVLAYSAIGGSWLLLVVLLLAPDLSMAGYLGGARLGAAIYAAAHSYVAPALLAHIGLDRLLGYGLKYPGASRHTHLGVIGRRSTDPSAE